MKGFLLFVKNNRIIYKISVMFIIMMLIFAMQINPRYEKDNIDKKSVGATINADYTIRFDASTKKFYKSTDTVNEVNPSIWGITLSNEGGVPVLKFNNVYFHTTAANILSGNIKAYGGSSGVSEGIVCVKNVYIFGGNVNVNTTTQRSSTTVVSAALSSKKVATN